MPDCKAGMDNDDEKDFLMWEVLFGWRKLPKHVFIRNEFSYLRTESIPFFGTIQKVSG